MLAKWIICIFVVHKLRWLYYQKPCRWDCFHRDFLYLEIRKLCVVWCFYVMEEARGLFYCFKGLTFFFKRTQYISVKFVKVLHLMLVTHVDEIKTKHYKEYYALLLFRIVKPYVYYTSGAWTKWPPLLIIELWWAPTTLTTNLWYLYVPRIALPWVMGAGLKAIHVQSLYNFCTCTHERIVTRAGRRALLKPRC